MVTDCEKCAVIVRTELALDRLAAQLDRRVTELCAPSMEENNRRWTRFAALCRVPVAGAAFLKLRKAPDLVDVPKFWEEPWYLDTGGSIETQAHALELLKFDDLEHWGDELVHPADPDDPAGYTTPDISDRRACYRLGLQPFLPDKYDYHSLAGTDKHYRDLLVMCSETLALMPIGDCSMAIGESTDGKPIYKSLKTA